MSDIVQQQHRTFGQQQNYLGTDESKRYLEKIVRGQNNADPQKIIKKSSNQPHHKKGKKHRIQRTKPPNILTQRNLNADVKQGQNVKMKQNDKMILKTEVIHLALSKNSQIRPLSNQANKTDLIRCTQNKEQFSRPKTPQKDIKTIKQTPLFSCQQMQTISISQQKSSKKTTQKLIDRYSFTINKPTSFRSYCTDYSNREIQVYKQERYQHRYLQQVGKHKVKTQKQQEFRLWKNEQNSEQLNFVQKGHQSNIYNSQFKLERPLFSSKSKYNPAYQSPFYNINLERQQQNNHFTHRQRICKDYFLSMNYQPKVYRIPTSKHSETLSPATKTTLKLQCKSPQKLSLISKSQLKKW